MGGLRRAVLAGLGGIAALLMAAPVAGAQVTELVSRASGVDGADGDRGSWLACCRDVRPNVMSADGRFVVFSSDATNLDPDDMDGSGWTDVYVRDRFAHRTFLASRAGGAAGASADARAADGAISADGRFVAFVSPATNLHPDDTEPDWDVFLRDVVQNTTVLVSRASGVAGANGNGAEPAISSDGRLVTFESTANLHPDDSDGLPDVYVRDVVAGTTVLASRGAGGNSNDWANSPAISGDGRFVAFLSPATNLHPDDTGSGWDVFVRDLQAGSTQLVTRAVDGGSADGASYEPAISADGRFVAFESSATNLHPDDPDTDTDIYRRDLQAGTTTLVSRGPGASGAKGNDGSAGAAISGDGRLVMFHSSATNLDPDDLDDDASIFVRDVTANTTTLMSRASGAAGANADRSANRGGISLDGRFVAFKSYAYNLHPDDLPSDGGPSWDDDVFVRDVELSSSPSAPDLAAASDSGVSQTDHVTNAADPVFVGSWTPFSVVEILFDGVVVASGTSDAAGAYAVVVNDPPEGTYVVRARGFATPQSAAMSPNLVIDRTGPAASIPDLQAGSDTGLSSSDDVTADPTPTFDGVNSPAEPSRTVLSVSPGGASATEGDGFADGDYVVGLGALADGSYGVRARSADVAGNVGALSGARSFVIDTVAPESTITSGPVGPTNDATPEFEFTSDPGAVFECSVDQGTVAFAACGSPQAFGPLADGSYTFRVRATDVAGNVESVPATRAFTVDTTVPETTITAGPSGRFKPGLLDLRGQSGTLTNDSTPEFAFVSSSAGSSFECRVDDGAFGPCSSPFTTPFLADGSHTFSVRATTAAGTTDPTPASSAFTVTPRCTLVGISLRLGGRPLTICLAETRASSSSSSAAARAGARRVPRLRVVSARLTRAGRTYAAGSRRGGGRPALRATRRVTAGRYLLRVRARTVTGRVLTGGGRVRLDKRAAQRLNRSLR